MTFKEEASDCRRSRWPFKTEPIWNL